MAAILGQILNFFKHVFGLIEMMRQENQNIESISTINKLFRYPIRNICF